MPPGLSERIARDLLELSRQPAVAVGRDGVILYCNDAFLEAVCRARGEAAGANWFDLFVAPEEREARRAAFAAALARGESAPLGDTLVTGRGERRAFEWRVGPLRDEHGAVVAVGGAAVERRGDEPAAAVASSRLNREIIAGAQEGVIVYGRDLRYKLWNPFMEKLTGVPARDTLGRHPRDVFPFLEPAGVIANAERALAGEQPEPIDVEFAIPGTGRSGWARDACAPLRDDAGAIVGVIATVSDITARRRAEDELRHSEARLSEAERVAMLGHWEWNIVTDALYWSDEIYRIFGIAKGDFPATYPAFLERVHPDDRAAVEAAVRRAVAAAAPYAIEHRIVTPEGELKHVYETGEVTFAGGRPVRMLGTVQDVTQRKHEEVEHRRLQERLAQAEKLESVGRLAGGVAHDFNNMLLVILGLAGQSLEQLPADHPVYENLTEIRRAAERSSVLTRQLLTFARRQPTTPKVIDLNQAVEGALKMLRRLIGEDIELVWRPGERLGPVRIDPGQVDQLLANLCANARDAIAGSGHIAITTRNEGDDAVVLEVADDGAGMDEATLARMFEPFFTNKEPGRGTGLGLATVYGIMQQNAGAVAATSRPGEGTTLRLTFPRAAAPAAPPATPSPAGPRAGRGATVLVIEDEPTILRVLKVWLAGAGYRVLTAETPEAALETAGAHAGEIDLVLSDLVMPHTNGRELAAALAARRPETKFVFMSGYSRDVVAQRGVLEPGLLFLQKPFELPDLLAKLAEALGD